MSAGICIMNKEAIALAADSAATIGERAAIRNSAQKLFPLSKSVAVICYGCTEFMTVPVEIILRMYAKSLGDRTFPRLEDYVEDLLRYLSKNGELLQFKQNEENYVRDIADRQLRILDNRYREALQEETARLNRELQSEEVKALGLRICEERFQDFSERYEKVKGLDFGEYLEKEKEFSSCVREYVQEGQKTDESFLWMDAETVEQLIPFLRDTLDTNFRGYYPVGVCVAGYGEQDIYPRLQHFTMDGWVNGSLRCEIENEKTINEDRRSWIETMAQDDVMDTIFLGMDTNLLPSLENTIREKTEECIAGINKRVLSAEKRNKILNALESLPDMVLEELWSVRRSEYWLPFLRATVTLGPQDMAAFAESMINLTSMRRNIILDDNTGTVGGPVDIAIVTKCDGFRWVKNKDANS